MHRTPTRLVSLRAVLWPSLRSRLQACLCAGVGALAAAGPVAAQDGSAESGSVDESGWIAHDQVVTSIAMPGDPIPVSDLPDAETVFENYIEAIGGREAVFGIESRRFNGRVQIEVTPEDGEPLLQRGRVITHAAAPNLLVQDVIFPGVQSIRTYFDGSRGWRETDTGDTTLLEGEELSRISNSANFYQLADYKNHFTRYSVVGGADEDGTRVARIDAEFSSGRIESYIFSLDSWLLIAVLTDRQIPDGARAALVRQYQDYQEHDGVFYPMRTTEKYGNVVLAFEIQSIETNVVIPAIEPPALLDSRGE